MLVLPGAGYNIFRGKNIEKLHIDLLCDLARFNFKNHTVRPGPIVPDPKASPSSPVNASSNRLDR